MPEKETSLNCRFSINSASRCMHGGGGSLLAAVNDTTRTEDEKETLKIVDIVRKRAGDLIWLLTLQILLQEAL